MTCRWRSRTQVAMVKSYEGESKRSQKRVRRRREARHSGLISLFSKQNSSIEYVCPLCSNLSREVEREMRNFSQRVIEALNNSETIEAKNPRTRMRVQSSRTRWVTPCTTRYWKRPVRVVLTWVLKTEMARQEWEASGWVDLASGQRSVKKRSIILTT